MALYAHYLQKGITPDHIDKLGFLDKNFYAACMDMELEQKNKEIELRNKLIKDKKVYPTVVF